MQVANQDENKRTVLYSNTLAKWMFVPPQEFRHQEGQVFAGRMMIWMKAPQHCKIVLELERSKI